MPARPWTVTVVASAGAGIVVALLTGVLDVTPSALVGAVWYGYPLPWLRRLIIAPQYYPWRFDVVGLMLDVVVWSAVALAVALCVILLRARRTPSS